MRHTWKYWPDCPRSDGKRGSLHFRGILHDIMIHDTGVWYSEDLLTRLFTETHVCSRSEGIPVQRELQSWQRQRGVGELSQEKSRTPPPHSPVQPIGNAHARWLHEARSISTVLSVFLYLSSFDIYGNAADSSMDTKTLVNAMEMPLNESRLSLAYTVLGLRGLQLTNQWNGYRDGQVFNSLIPNNRRHLSRDTADTSHHCYVNITPRNLAVELA